MAGKLPSPPMDLGTRPAAVAPAGTAGGRGAGAGPVDAAGRWRRVGGLAGLAAATAYVWAVDPSGHGIYPRCPSRVLFHVDCPACGGLRGTHDLLHGHVRAALDHNLLLPVYLGAIAVVMGLWLLPLAGRPARTPHPPRWAWIATAAVLVAFTVLRNLPVAGLRFLDSA
jgi:Protein of unknown function (DUF2752)